jgi:hypothetical protein
LLETRCVTPSDRQELSLDNHSAACRPLRENFLYTIKAGPAGGNDAA